MNKRIYIYKAIGLLIGLAIFAYTIEKFGGLELVFNKLKYMKYYYVLIVINSFCWMLFYTEAWRFLFGEVKKKIKFVSLLRVKLSGEAINLMTPLGFIAGDPIRVLLIRKIVGSDARLRTVVVDRALHSIAAQVFNLIAICVLFTQSINFPLWLNIFLVSLYTFLCFILISLVVSMLSGKGFGFLEPIFKFINFSKRLPKVNNKLLELKEDLLYYRDRSKKPIFQALGLHFLGRILGAIEILIALYCFEGHVNLVFAVILTALTSFFTFSFGFIPGALGVLETLYASFFHLYGYDPDVGITIQIVRRLRVLFWIAVGILVIEFDEIIRYFKKDK